MLDVRSLCCEAYSLSTKRRIKIDAWEESVNVIHDFHIISENHQH
jgi:hypothetical protein